MDLLKKRRIIDALSAKELAEELANNGLTFAYQATIDCGITGNKFMVLAAEDKAAFSSSLSKVHLELFWSFVLSVQSDVSRFVLSNKRDIQDRSGSAMTRTISKIEGKSYPVIARKPSFQQVPQIERVPSKRLVRKPSISKIASAFELEPQDIQTSAFKTSGKYAFGKVSKQDNATSKTYVASSKMAKNIKTLTSNESGVDDGVTKFESSSNEYPFQNQNVFKEAEKTSTHEEKSKLADVRSQVEVTPNNNADEGLSNHMQNNGGISDFAKNRNLLANNLTGNRPEESTEETVLPIYENLTSAPPIVPKSFHVVQPEPLENNEKLDALRQRTGDESTSTKTTYVASSKVADELTMLVNTSLKNHKLPNEYPAEGEVKKYETSDKYPFNKRKVVQQAEKKTTVSENSKLADERSQTAEIELNSSGYEEIVSPKVESIAPLYENINIAPPVPPKSTKVLQEMQSVVASKTTLWPPEKASSQTVVDSCKAADEILAIVNGASEDHHLPMGSEKEMNKYETSEKYPFKHGQDRNKIHSPLSKSLQGMPEENDDDAQGAQKLVDVEMYEPVPLVDVDDFIRNLVRPMLPTRPEVVVLNITRAQGESLLQRKDVGDFVFRCSSTYHCIVMVKSNSIIVNIPLRKENGKLFLDTTSGKTPNYFDNLNDFVEFYKTHDTKVGDIIIRFKNMVT